MNYMLLNFYVLSAEMSKVILFNIDILFNYFYDSNLFGTNRYIEFILVVDRGTRFGFSAPGIIPVDGFLISLPITAMWKYMYTPEEGSEEHKMLEVLKNPREWVQNKKE